MRRELWSEKQVSPKYMYALERVERITHLGILHYVSTACKVVTKAVQHASYYHRQDVQQASTGHQAVCLSTPSSTERIVAMPVRTQA